MMDGISLAHATLALTTHDFLGHAMDWELEYEPTWTAMPSHSISSTTTITTTIITIVIVIVICMSDSPLFPWTTI